MFGSPSRASRRIAGVVDMSTEKEKPKNVLGEDLQSCCFDPMTGYYRDGFCRTDGRDRGAHTVCAIMTDEFLEFSKSRGNDLSTPLPEFGFPGLKAGDQWCLCAARWVEAEEAGKAPRVILEACHERTLDYTDLETLKRYARMN